MNMEWGVRFFAQHRRSFCFSALHACSASSPLEWYLHLLQEEAHSGLLTLQHRRILDGMVFMALPAMRCPVHSRYGLYQVSVLIGFREILTRRSLLLFPKYSLRLLYPACKLCSPVKLPRVLLSRSHGLLISRSTQSGRWKIETST